jgi:uncharacterized protein YdcH (DUF465 family)
MNDASRQLQDGIDEMEATIERLREEMERLAKQRNALKEGNLELYRMLPRVCKIDCVNSQTQ